MFFIIRIIYLKQSLRNIIIDNWRIDPSRLNIKSLFYSLRPYILVYPVIPYRDELGDFSWNWFFAVLGAAGPCIMLWLWWGVALLYSPKYGKRFGLHPYRKRVVYIVIAICIPLGFLSLLFYVWFIFIYDPNTYYDIIRGYYRDGTEVVPGQWPKKRGW